VESKEFRHLLLLLREKLEDDDIPHRTTITKKILARQTEHFKTLSTQMLVSYYCYFLISYFQLMILE
jgi:hypothetical protein